MKTTTATSIPPHTRHTQHTHLAPMVSLPQLEGEGQVWRTPELFTPPPCPHDYCILLLTTTTIISNNSIM